MKIDLHCHTKSTKQGDGDGRNVSLELFKEKIANADVKIIAITNHNSFDLEQYNSFSSAVKDYCQVWPGVEIDVDGNEGKYHLIVVANPDNVDLFTEKVEKLFSGENIETCKIKIGDIYSQLNECDVIYIPHLCKKPDISSVDQEELLQLVKDDSRVFLETPNNRSLGIFANHDYNVIIGSDVKNWNKYEQSTFAELKLPVENFTQFCLLSKKDDTIVNTLLNKKGSYNLKANPHKTVSLDLKIYQDVNIIFGQKGTGKSEIINTLYDCLLSKDQKCTKYTGSEKDEDFKNLLKNNDMKINIEELGITDCRSEFEFVQSWTDITPTLIADYRNWFDTKDNNANKARMKITNATTILKKVPEDFSVHKEDYANVKKAVKNLEKIDITNYLDENSSEIFSDLLEALKENILRNYTNDLVEMEAVELTNFTIDKIKAIADKNSNSVSKPSSTGFKEYAMNRLKLKNYINKIADSITDKETFELEPLGEIEGKGQISIKKLYRMLSDDSKTKEFDLGITALKDAKEIIQQIQNNMSSDKLFSIVDTFNNLCQDKGINSAECFLGRSKCIVAEDGNEYSPSNGEKGILMLQRNLEKDVDAYFLDEPELGMGNSYVNNIICPQIEKLAKRHKVVVVATHNANIAVRSLPYASFFRTHENGVYKTYAGNPFNDKLINIDDPDDIKSWSYESLHTLEGGKEAFYERKYIYESNN
jgi:hypothetical protein